ncbi:MAG: hypothetical protein IVW57_19315 [Ktedonobacterales bacterium]|nr:hypothetical protein [Ktedonobacterales bacterium]
MSALISWINGNTGKQDITDLMRQLPTLFSSLVAAIGGDLMALIPFVSALTSIIRDVLDILVFVGNLAAGIFGTSNGITAFAARIRGFSVLLDYLQPVVNGLGTFFGAFFNPLGALTSRLGSYWEPVLEKAFSGFADDQLLGWIARQVFGEAANWMFTGTANGIAAVSAPLFCSLFLAVCQAPLPVPSA